MKQLMTVVEWLNATGTMLMQRLRVSAVMPASLLTLLMFAGGLQTVSAQLPLADTRLQPEKSDRYLDNMQSGGPGKDGIPAIDRPKFWNVSQANDYLDDKDIVYGVYHNGEAKAYPQRILVWHELVNDTIGGKPLSVSYCPLTATAIGFERGSTTLGVSGNLINSNMVMYDRATDSYWPQILATAIRGEHKGRALREHRVVWTTWENWKERHPETRVLNTETGHMRNYRRDPYGEYNPKTGYYAVGSSRMFPVMNDSADFPDKHTILGFRTEDVAVAIDLNYLRNNKIIQHTRSGKDFLIIYDPGLDTGWVYRNVQSLDVDYAQVRFGSDGPRFPSDEKLSPVNAFKAMWFSWVAYYPDTSVVGNND